MNGQREGDRFSGIEVRIDLEKAAEHLGLSRDQRALITTLYNSPELSELEAGRELGWSVQRLDRVTRSLREDRLHGYGLRLFLKDYLKDPEEVLIKSAVRENEDSAA